MIVLTSVPIFVLNVIFSIIATKKIINACRFSDYKPRFDFLFLLVWGYIPLSFASALTDSFFLKTINQSYYYCLFFSIQKYFAYITFIVPPIYSLYFFLLMFTKLNKGSIDRLGNIMCVVLFTITIIRVFIMTVFIGIEKDNVLEDGRFSECSCSSKGEEKYNFYFTLLIQIIVILFIFLVIGYEKYLAQYGDEKNPKKKFSRVNTIKSFIFIVITTLVLGILDRIVKQIDFLPKWFYYMFNDIKRSKPFFYSLIIIFCDKPISLNIKNYTLDIIFNIPELNKIFEHFLNKKGSKRMKKLVNDYKGLLKKNEENEKGGNSLSANNEKERCEIEKGLGVLEKEIFIEGLNEFYLTDEFILFLYKFQNTGIIELEMDLDRG